ncbi:hypothetical protein BD769DRAFT_1632796 [Suillus cothurnatus]|nr:hypothetical protein BD769DRAFT_1632796 [Suillus cothurnatus]
MVPQTILVASYTDSIYTLSFDLTPLIGSLTLKLLAQTPIGYHPSWIGSHPSNNSLIIQGSNRQMEKSSQSKVVARAKSGGADPCTLLVTEDELIIGNHVGRNKACQSSSHPHQVILNPLNQTEKELLVPDLGADKVWRLTKRSNGKWSICGHINFEAGVAHDILTPEILLNVMTGSTSYTLLELTLNLAVHTFPPLPAPPTLLTPSEVLLPEPNASFPETFIYTSNRNDPHLEGDTIAPELVNEARTGLTHVRGMVFGGNDDKYLVVGGVEGGGVKVFERIEGRKGLKEITKLIEDVGCPTGFLWY